MPKRKREVLELDLTRRLPDELLLKILGYLSDKDLLTKASRVDGRWKRVARSCIAGLRIASLSRFSKLPVLEEFPALKSLSFNLHAGESKKFSRFVQTIAGSSVR